MCASRQRATPDRLGALSAKILQITGPHFRSPHPESSAMEGVVVYLEEHGAVDFDLGSVHFVGSSSTTQFACHNGASSTTDCDDGHDANGATCVDDGTCDGSEETEGSGSESEGSGSGSDFADAAEGPDDGDAVAEHNF